MIYRSKGKLRIIIMIKAIVVVALGREEERKDIKKIKLWLNLLVKNRSNHKCLEEVVLELIYQ